MKKRIYEKETVHFVDSEGEEVRASQTKYKGTISTEPTYVKMYQRDIGNLHNLSKIARTVLDEIAVNMDYDNEYPLIGPNRDKIIKNLDIKGVTLEKALTELVAKNIIKRVSRGYYKVSPFYFAKGRWPDIDKIRVTITYDDKGRDIEAEFESKKK